MISTEFGKIIQILPVGSFAGTTDRLTIQSDNHPKPVWTQAEAAPGGGPLVDRNLNQTFIYRGGKDVPNPGTRAEQDNKVLGILANGGLLHTPEWGTTGNAPTNFAIDSIKYDYVKIILRMILSPIIMFSIIIQVKL